MQLEFVGRIVDSSALRGMVDAADLVSHDETRG